MNNRFKFRVWITAPITRDVEEEKEVSFYIYDIALYDDGGIGFSRDSLLDALDKLNLTEGQRNEIEDYISDNSYSEDWEWYVISFDTIEQCTGLKDKNGKLIYEGDILGGIFNMLVFWCKKCCSFEVGIPMNDGTIECSACDGDVLWWDVVREDDLEVIGNIHENIDLLEKINE